MEPEPVQKVPPEDFVFQRLTNMVYHHIHRFVFIYAVASR